MVEQTGELLSPRETFPWRNPPDNVRKGIVAQSNVFAGDQANLRDRLKARKQCGFLGSPRVDSGF